MSVHERWMRHALDLAHRAEEAGEVPVGAVLVYEGEIIGEGHNRPISTHDASAHAEMIALRAATARLQNYRLPASTQLFVTLEPCAMCAGALVHARVSEVIYGAPDPRAGAAGSIFNILDSEALNHRARITGGMMEKECGEILKNFFRARRGL